MINNLKVEENRGESAKNESTCDAPSAGLPRTLAACGARTFPYRVLRPQTGHATAHYSGVYLIEHAGADCGLRCLWW